MFITRPSSMFKEAKVAQMAAFFLSQQDESMHVLKLMKLLYLSDRKALEVTGFPITFDAMVSMPHGPVLSRTLGYINGSQGPGSDWEYWVSDRADHKVALNHSFQDAEELAKLSQADVNIMADVWTGFRDMGPFEISDYTHDHCAEWNDPKGSSIPINYSDIFKALGKSASEAESYQEEIEQQKALEVRSIEVMHWDKVFTQSRREHIELLAAMLNNAKDFDHDDRAQSALQFGGNEAKELLLRLSESNQELKDYIHRIDDAIEAKASNKNDQ